MKTRILSLAAVLGLGTVLFAASSLAPAHADDYYRRGNRYDIDYRRGDVDFEIRYRDSDRDRDHRRWEREREERRERELRREREERREEHRDWERHHRY